VNARTRLNPQIDPSKNYICPPTNSSLVHIDKLQRSCYTFVINGDELE